MSHNNAIECHIIEIIKKYRICEQIELQKLLKEQGLMIPQATLSRRLKKLKIVKIDGVYNMLESEKSIKPFILEMEISEWGIVVLRTLPGHAGSVAYFFDQKYVCHSYSKKSGIIGTIAGDDTVLIIIKSKNNLADVIHMIKKDFPDMAINK